MTRLARLACALAMSWIASAGAVVVEQPLTPAAPTTLGEQPYLFAVRPVRHLGTPERTIPVLVGEGRKVTFAQALQAIVPPGWKGFASDPRLRTIGVVSWRGERRPWLVVLEEFLMQYDLVAVLDWDRRELTVQPGPLFGRSGG